MIDFDGIKKLTRFEKKMATDALVWGDNSFFGFFFTEEVRPLEHVLIITHMLCYNNDMKRFLISLSMFAIIGSGVFFGAQYITKTGIFKIPGVVYYGDGLCQGELDILHEIFTEEVVLDKDVTITASDSFERPELHEGEFLYRVAVPVTDFYSMETSVTAESVEELFENYSEGETKLIDVENLDGSKRLLAINDEYYLDSFEKGAVFRVIKFESEKYEEEIKPLIGDRFVKTFPEKETVLTFAQTGVTALSRGMNSKLWSVGSAQYFAEKIGDFLSSFDLTHTSNESSFSGYATARNICSDRSFIDTLLAIGLDIVELTGNHNQDCGDESALETIDVYDQHGIKMVGGGKTATEAKEPLLITEKGNGITFLAYNQSTGGATYDNTPGANQYYEEDAAAQISAAKERGDFVIVDIQYYECSAYASTYEDKTCDYAGSSAGDQIGFFRHLIDLGADMVVGTSAHQPQTFELYGNGVIYYGLGNLFFDQLWWPGTTRSLILGHYFYNGKLLQTRIYPTVYDSNMQTTLMDEESKDWFLRRLISERP